MAVLTDADGAGRVDALDVPALVVEEPRALLADLCAWFHDHPAEAFTTIGVTGTQGKTTTTYLAEAALGARRSAVVGGIVLLAVGAAAAYLGWTRRVSSPLALTRKILKEEVQWAKKRLA